MCATDSNRTPERASDDSRRRDYWGEAPACRCIVPLCVLPRVAVFGLISALITSFTPPDLNIPAGPHKLAGVVLGLLLVLRTNAAYERWREASELWGGIANRSRGLALRALSHGPRDPRWRREVVRWTIAFAHVCRRSLQGEREVPEVEALLGAAGASRVARAEHGPTAVSRAIGAFLRDAHDRGTMSGFAFLRAEAERAALIDHVGACERLLETPPDGGYSIGIRRFIVLFLGTLTFALLSKFDPDWLVPPFVMLIAYVVLSLDLIGYELQDPFQPSHAGRLPLDDICRTIEEDLLGLLAQEQLGSDDPVTPGGGEFSETRQIGADGRPGAAEHGPFRPREAAPNGRPLGPITGSS